MLCVAKRLFLCFSVYAVFGFNLSMAEVISYEAYGRDEVSALGNLKMTALRETVKKLLVPDDIRTHSAELRKGLFLRVNEFVSVGDDIIFRDENGKIFITGSVEVDRKAVISVIKGIPGLESRILTDEAGLASSDRQNLAESKEPDEEDNDVTGNASSFEPEHRADKESFASDKDEHPAGASENAAKKSDAGDDSVKKTADEGLNNEDSVSLVLTTAGFIVSMFLM